ncbi:MAG TPA: hypothetical protein VMW41_06890 [Candidatus Bathyarchaeia archaeon]|nr:hypothetical protein [Candidatus Bathyarchaeia archaeon]
MNAKTIIIPTLVLALLGFVGYGTAKAFAANGNGNYPPIIDKLVERFGLNREEVQKVFDEERTQRQQQMQANFEERLNQAVSEGKITEEQKKAIIAKKAEMQAECEGFKDLSLEERKTKMEEYKKEMESWAQENGIDLSLIPMFLGRGPHRGFGGRGGPGF